MPVTALRYGKLAACSSSGLMSEHTCVCSMSLMPASCTRVGDRFVDHVVYAMLARDWDAAASGDR